MKTIWCVGDSNTWGYKPSGRGRYTAEQRWPRLMASQLGAAYQVVEDGALGRSLKDFYPLPQHWLPKFAQQSPDLLIMLLGTNDLQARFALSAEQIAQAAGDLIAALLDNGLRFPVVLVAPPPVREGGFFREGYQGAADKSAQFARCFLRQAKSLDCAYLDAGAIVQSCEQEGVHWPLCEHQKMAEAMVSKVLNVL